MTNLVVSGTGAFIDINGVSTLTINGTLTGSGDLLLKPELVTTGAGTISIAGISAYTGALTVQAPVRLDFGSSYTFTNSLTLQTTAILNVDQSLTIEEGKLIANGVTIPAGTYTGAGITGLGANFVDGGGTLTVVAKDTDADGLPDYWKNLIINADPGDLVDGFEDVAGPNNAPATTDFDSDDKSDANDNMADDWELTYGLDPDSSADAGESLDLDTLTNLQEFQHGTNPTLVDTDGDGIEDDIEVMNGTDPTNAASPGTRPHVTDFITTKNGAGQITKIEVVFNGLVANKTYTLVRGTDLASFPDTIETKLATSTTYTFTDSAPLPDGTSSRAFYRLQD